MVRPSVISLSSPFTVIRNFTEIKKPYPRRPPYDGRGIRFKLVPSQIFNRGTATLTLPYAGAIRIRFKGLPGKLQALSPLRTPPA